MAAHDRVGMRIAISRRGRTLESRAGRKWRVSVEQRFEWIGEENLLGLLSYPPCYRVVSWACRLDLARG